MPNHSEIDASLGIYNPASLPPEVLLEEFIARRPLLDRALGIVRDNHRGQPQQHLLLLGPRGTGKTTFLLALAYSIQRDPGLSHEWLPVIFPEETYGIGDLADFWLEATEQLLHTTGNETVRTEVESLRESNPEDIEERAHALFLRHVDASGKRVLLGIENLNDFFSAVSDETQQHRLRAFLMKDDRMMLAASSTSYFDASGKIDLPFYEFFRILRLERLTVQESIEVLSRLAELRSDSNVLSVVQNQPERIHSLHVLTGGNPRLIKMIYRLLNEGIEGDARRDLNRLLEDCTPYFKSRIEEISTEERRVFDHVARHWDPVAVGDIQTALRRPSNKVSIYLRRLVESGFLEEAPTSTQKRKYYQVAERFYNIYYLMRFARSSRRRLEWLIQAMRVIYSPDDFKSWTDKTLTAWREDGGRSATGEREAFLHALTIASDANGLRKELIEKTLQTAWTHDQFECLDHLLDRELARQTLGEEFDLIDFFAHLSVDKKEELGYEPTKAIWWCCLAIALSSSSRYTEAILAYRKAIEIDPNISNGWLGLGLVLYKDISDYKEAERAYRKAIDIDPTAVVAYRALGILLNHLQRYDEAELIYLKMIEIDPNMTDAWIQLGNVLSENPDRHGAAEHAFRKAIELDPSDNYSWCQLGNLLKKYLGRYPEAEQAYRKAIEINEEDGQPWFFLGVLLNNFPERLTEAEQAFQRVIQVEPHDFYSWCFLGDIRRRLKRDEDAEHAYRHAIEINSKAPFAYAGLSELFHNRSNPSEARKYAINAGLLGPSELWPRRQFLKICGDDVQAWLQLIPELLGVLTAPILDPDVVEMTFRGLEFVLSHKAITPHEMIAMIESAGNPEPLADIILALRSIDEPRLLDKVSPERRTVARDFIKRVFPKRKK